MAPRPRAGRRIGGDVELRGRRFGGGNLTLALLLKRRDAGRALPQAAVALSPATDLTWQSPSIQERADRDPILRPARIPLVVQAYLQGKAAPTDPYVSPLYGDFRGLPPLLLQTGEAEILYDDSYGVKDRLPRRYLILR